MLEQFPHHILHIFQSLELCQVLHSVLIAVSESECCLYCIRFTIIWLGRFVWARRGLSLWMVCWTSHSCSVVVGLFQLLLALLRQIPRTAVF